MNLHRVVTNSVLLFLGVCLLTWSQPSVYAQTTGEVSDEQVLKLLKEEQTRLAGEMKKLDEALAVAMEKRTAPTVTAVSDSPQPSTQGSGFSKFDALIAGLSIFVLAVFVGFEVITKVPPTLHTPLMSGSNAISGITIVGALLVAGRNDYASLLGILAIVFAMINVIGGFWVTHRMLSMFKR